MTEHLNAAGYRELTPGRKGEERNGGHYQRNYLVTPVGKKIERLEVPREREGE